MAAGSPQAGCGNKKRHTKVITLCVPVFYKQTAEDYREQPAATQILNILFCIEPFEVI